MNIAMAIICFGKADEVLLFLDSLYRSDLAHYPKFFVVNTDYENNIKEDQVVKNIQQFQNPHDAIFVSRKNSYLGSYRYVMQEYIFPFYDTIIGTEADFWFEQPLKFQMHIEFLLHEGNTGAISVLARPYTEAVAGLYTSQRFFSYRRYKGAYLKIRRGPQPWHLCVTKTQYLEQYFKSTGWELSDFEFFYFCQRTLNKQVLCVDCRKNAVHFDACATQKKYPVFEKLRIPQKLHTLPQQLIDRSDIVRLNIQGEA